MASSQHGRPNMHKVRNCMLAIADKLVGVSCEVETQEQGERRLLEDCLRLAPRTMLDIQIHANISTDAYASFTMIEFHSSGKSSLCKKANLRDDQLVKL